MMMLVGGDATVVPLQWYCVRRVREGLAKDNNVQGISVKRAFPSGLPNFHRHDNESRAPTFELIPINYRACDIKMIVEEFYFHFKIRLGITIKS